MDGRMGPWADGRSITRRDAILSTVAAAGIAAIAPPIRPSAHPPIGRLKQSASRWCYRSIALPDLCKAGKAMGLAGIDLLAPEDWPIVRQNGLVCSMGYAAIRDDFIPRGFNDPANHDLLVGELKDLYSAENQLVKALPKIIKKAASEELKEALTAHLEETRQQVQRLDKIFAQVRPETSQARQKALMIEVASRLVQLDWFIMLYRRATNRVEVVNGE